MKHRSSLKPFLRTGLDILFVALNAPVQSHENQHWFSGRGSRFFRLLARSGLTIEEVPRQTADEIVFGSVERNHKRASFGVVDLVPDLVETKSSSVRPTRQHVERLVETIREHKPRFVCVIHARVRDAFNESGLLLRTLAHGANGPLLKDRRAEFFVNYFPNGNNIPDAPKIEVFKQLRDRL